MMISKKRKRILFIGGGLSSILSAYFVKHEYPKVEIVLVEKSDKLGGHHTWSFHSSDISKKTEKVLEPLLFKKWKGHSLYFSKFQRELSSLYYTIRSEGAHSVLLNLLGPEAVRLNQTVERINFKEVIFSSGEVEKFDLIFDATGFGSEPTTPCGYQKFVGLDIELTNPHNLVNPILMDAKVKQIDGFRFFYVLPFSEKNLLVEDTRYANTPAINEDEYIKEIISYTEERWGPVKQVLRKEKASLPIPLIQHKKVSVNNLIIPLGVKADLYHPTTGYSFPYAVRAAQFVAKNIQKHPTVFTRKYRQFLAEERKSSKFYFVLNKMLFGAARPEQRIEIFEHFYRLPDDIVGRFYSGRSSKLDMVRILSGKPPVSISKAIKSVLTKKWMNSFSSKQQ